MFTVYMLIITINTRKCTTLWGEPDRVHTQNMEQLHAFDCHQNVAEPQATENHKIYTRVHRNCESGLVIIFFLFIIFLMKIYVIKWTKAA